MKKKKKQKNKCICGSKAFEVKKVPVPPDSLDNIVDILICKKCGIRKADDVEHIG